MLALIIAGCTSNAVNTLPTSPDNTGNVANTGNAPAGNRSYNPRNNPGLGNMTDAQRQQFQQAMVDACNGKSENDSCVAIGPQGDLNGTCRLRNDTLSCAMQGRFRGNGTGYQRPSQ